MPTQNKTGSSTASIVTCACHSVCITYGIFKRQECMAHGQGHAEAIHDVKTSHSGHGDMRVSLGLHYIWTTGYRAVSLAARAVTQAEGARQPRQDNAESTV